MLCAYLMVHNRRPIIITKQRDCNSIIALKVLISKREEEEKTEEEEEFHNSSGKDLHL